MPRTPDKGMLAPAPLRHSAKLPQHVCEATPWGRVLKAAEMRESRLLGRIPRLKLLLPYLKQDARHDWAGLPPCMPCMDQQLVRHIVLDVLDSTLPASAKQAVLEGIFGLENFSGAQQWCARRHGCTDARCRGSHGGVSLLAAVEESDLPPSCKDGVLAMLAGRLDLTRERSAGEPMRAVLGRAAGGGGEGRLSVEELLAAAGEIEGGAPAADAVARVHDRRARRARLLAGGSLVAGGVLAVAVAIRISTTE